MGRPIPYEFDLILFVERRAGARPCRNVATLPEVTGIYKIKNYMSFRGRSPPLMRHADRSEASPEWFHRCRYCIPLNRGIPRRARNDGGFTALLAAGASHPTNVQSASSAGDHIGSPLRKILPFG